MLVVIWRDQSTGYATLSTALHTQELSLTPREELLATLEQAVQGVEQQALAETPGARKEVVLVLLDQALDHRGLVDVVVAPLNDLGEGLDPDGQAFLPGGGQGNLL